MQRLIISNEYPKRFVYKYLPQVFYQIAKGRVLAHRKSKMNDYLKDNYKISMDQVIHYFKLIKIDKYEDTYIVHLDLDDKRIREIFHLISYGNLEVQGLRVVDGTFEYIAGNIPSLYRRYILEENLRLKKANERR